MNRKDKGAKQRTETRLKAIPYYRVSTQRQGYSGLGLEAQKQSVEAFAKTRDIQLLGEYIEVESGFKIKRPVLQKAIAHCKKDNAILIIARLDRLARNVYFIACLIHSGVDFRTLENFDGSRLITYVQAAVAEEAREQISKNTIAALQAAKRRGVKLGTFGKEVLSKRNKRKADGFAKKMKPIIAALKKSGFKTLRAISEQLNKRHVAPFSGPSAQWHINSVFNLIKRIGKLKNE